MMGWEEILEAMVLSRAEMWVRVFWKWRVRAGGLGVSLEVEGD